MKNLKQKAYNLLRRSESVFKTDMVYLAKGGFWLTFSQVIVSLSAFAMAIAFAHFLTKEDYGEYKYILSITSVLGILTLTGLGTSVTKSVTEGYEGTLTFAFWQNIKWSALYFIVSLIVSIYYFFNNNSVLGIGLLFAGSLAPFISSTNLYGSYLIAKKDFKRSAIYFDILGNIFPYLCLFATMAVTKSVLWLLISYFVSNAVIGLILYTRVIKIYSPNKKIDPGGVYYGWHLSLINILNTVASNIDQILVFHFIGAAELAVYNFAVAIPNQLKGPIKNLGNLMFPKFVDREEKDLHRSMNNKFIWFGLFGLFFTITYILLAPYIFHLFFNKYSDAIIYSQIFSISILGTIFTPAGIYLSAKKKIKEQYINSMSVSIMQIILVVLGIMWKGLLGLIIARVIIRLSGNILTWLLYIKSSRINKLLEIEIKN